jgi:hypothetical protein
LPGGEHIYALGFSAICRAIWLTRNKSCFDKKTIKHPAEIVMLACALMKYWAGLYKTEVQEQLVEGADIMLAIACKLLAEQGDGRRLLLEAEDGQDREMNPGAGGA